MAYRITVNQIIECRGTSNHLIVRGLSITHLTLC